MVFVDVPLKISVKVAKSARFIAPSSFRSEQAHAVDTDGDCPKQTANEAKSTKFTVPPLASMSPQFVTLYFG